eukprot:749436-Hanusia_phi.AAC.4
MPPLQRRRWERDGRQGREDGGRRRSEGGATTPRASNRNMLGALLLPCLVSGLLRPCCASKPEIVYTDETLGLSMTEHARTIVHANPHKREPRNRGPIVYFYSRGGREIKNRGAEVFHQLHDAVRREGIESYLEDGVQEYKTEDSNFIEDYELVFNNLTSHDFVIVTAIPHAMDESQGYLMPGYTGAPFLADKVKVIKWQIGYSFPSLSYFVDEKQHMICDTYFLSDVMGCVKEAYIRAPPLDMYYSAAEKAREESEDGSMGLFKERLVLYDNDHEFDISKLQLREGCMLVKLDGLSRSEMFDAYKRAVAVVDLWLPGAETVTAEGALFDCCVLVPNEMNGANPRDFPIDSKWKVRRTLDGAWDYMQISELLNRALDNYDDFVQEFRELKQHVLRLPEAFQLAVHRYFANDIHFVAIGYREEEREHLLPWAVSVLMNYPIATVEIVVYNRFRLGLASSPVLQVLRQKGIAHKLIISDGVPSRSQHPFPYINSGPTVSFQHAMQAPATCFASPFASFLRPDLLELVESTSSAWADALERFPEAAIEGEPGSSWIPDPWPVECFATGLHSTKPLEDAWANMGELWRTRYWDGALMYTTGAIRL